MHNRPYLNPKSLFDKEGDVNKQPNEADVDRKHSVFPPRTDACFCPVNHKLRFLTRAARQHSVPPSECEHVCESESVNASLGVCSSRHVNQSRDM